MTMWCITTVPSLDGAVSEKIIKGGHSISGNARSFVLELRRILRLHLQDLGLYKP